MPSGTAHTSQPEVTTARSSSAWISAASPAPEDTSLGEDSNHDLEASVMEASVPSPSVLVSEDLPISPSEDVCSYGDLIHRMAARLGIPTAQPTLVVNDIVFNVVRAQTSAIAIPMLKVML